MTTVLASGRRDVHSRLAARGRRARPGPALRAAHAAGRRRAQADHDHEAGDDGRHLEPRAGVALRLRDPARQDDGPVARARRPLRVGVAAPRRARGEAAHGRTLGDGHDPDDVRDHAGGRLLVRGQTLARVADLDRHARRVHHGSDAALLPDRTAAQRPDRRADVARALRPGLRVPRPPGRDRGAARRTPARATSRCAARSRSTTSGFATARIMDAARTCRSRSRRARRRRSSARPGPGRRPSATSSRGSTTSRRAGHDRRRRRPRPHVRLARRLSSASSRRRRTCSTRRVRENLRFACPDATRRSRSRLRPAPRRSIT